MPLRALVAASATALCLSIAAGSAPVHAQSAGVNIGRLECVVEGGVGLIITSKKRMQCIYRSTTGREETYFGSIRKFGLDIGVTGEAYMVWGVFAPGVVDDGAMAGDYVGQQVLVYKASAAPLARSSTRSFRLFQTCAFTRCRSN